MSQNSTSQRSIKIFKESIDKYHLIDEVDQAFENPYPADSLEHLLYRKNWIDTVQWHYEDLIRDPEIDPVEGMKLKRLIDASNQDRTDTVEYIDSYFLNQFKDVVVREDATVNSESPAWALDRLSILELKIYHMEEEANRQEASKSHREKCNAKLQVLLNQREDLGSSIDDLLQDIASGSKYMKIYKQMKMYNDEDTNPVLYKDKS
ncbi:DUF4254 domain-containing protein [Flavobacteriaceae bacterium]|nr:DUF4254 domain-containing protein [Flavobacteriaceae bacterium]MDA8758109.1 DUF4254 domain-containing protein [Flavobacteriaceae bacterium]MDA8763004.1 DUF4254 domain-containing protein [Flavobacteriaceae bacterium]MDC0478900.1 DUF4254 domain-containing protein [Flavobacteriaceae bacterium]